MFRKISTGFALLLLLLLAGKAIAATFTQPLCYYVSLGVCRVITLANPLPVVSN